MDKDANEEKQLRSVALQNAQSVRLVRQQAEEALRESEERLRHSNAELARRIAELQLANVELQYSRRAAFNLMEDALLARQLVEKLNTELRNEITERKQAEEAKARLAAIVESSDDAIISKDLNSIITSWNRGAERLFGYTAQEAIGQPITMLIPPDRFDEEPANLERIRRGEAIDDYDTIRCRKDGILLNISLTVSPIRNAQGEIVGASKIARDITERKQAEKAKQRLAAIIESSADAIISEDLNGIITSWNYGAEQIFDYRDTEIIGKPITILIPTDRHGEELAILARIRRGERIEHYETIRQSKDGSLLDISLTVSPIKDAEGKIIGASKIGRDITRRKQMEAALEEAKDAFAKELQKRVQERTVDLELANLALRKEMEEQKKLEKQLWQAQKMEIVGTLAGGVAHDFNNILNIIKGYTALIRESSPVDENTAESLHVIEETIERGAYGVRQLLTLARKTEARLALTNPNELLSDLSKLLKQTFPKTIDIALELDPKLPSIWIDSNQISQALLNLCINARDAMPGGGKLILKTHMVEGGQIQDAAATAESYVSIEVKDSGMGMDAAIRNRIFEPFFTTKGMGEGTGLGLAIVYSIVKNHKGVIDVDSEAGHGTTFRVYFPLAPSEAIPIVDELPERKSSVPKPTNGKGKYSRCRG